MSVTFKKVLRKDPFHKDGAGKYYPQLIVWGKSATLESIAVQMKESSSLTLGDIQSVITNFVGAMRRELFNGRSVNIDNFGVFSLSATTEGSEKKDDCQIHKVHTVFGTCGSHLRTNAAGSTEVDADGFDFGGLAIVLLLRTFGGSRKAEYAEVVDVHRTTIDRKSVV